MLKKSHRIPLPHHEDGEFDHADVYLPTGVVFAAHTTNGTVDVVDGISKSYLYSVEDCPGGSGVLSGRLSPVIFAASRSNGHILAINARTGKIELKFNTGPKPNGLALDEERRQLMVADVEDNRARFHDTVSGKSIGTVELRGRPRWAAYNSDLDEFMVNIRDPSGVEFIQGRTLKSARFVSISHKGPHGLAIHNNTAYVACDDGFLTTIDLQTLEERESAELAGPPDVLWYNVRKDLVYCAVGEPGMLQVFSGKTLEKLQEISTEYGAHTFAFDEKRQALYVLLPESCAADVYMEE